MEIVITAPHSLCRNIPERNCDRLALKVASGLYSRLNSREANVNLIVADQYRDVVNLNRSEGRNSYFREKLRSLIRNSPQSVIIDIHSFPHNVEGIWGNLRVKDYPELIILTRNDAFSFSFIPFLMAAGVDFTTLRGSDKNDIVLEASKYGSKSLLLEFRENLNERQIENIYTAIINFLTTLK